MTLTSNIAIIGAGCAGLTLALTLHKRGIPCKVYEAAPGPRNVGGTLVLCPNGLKILDELGVYQDILSRGREDAVMEFRRVPGLELVDTVELGNTAKYGYNSVRVLRRHVMDVLLGALIARGITVHYKKRFARVLLETHEAVAWLFDDGTTGRATTALVGADGIHSRLRAHLHPDVALEFTHVFATTAIVPASQVCLPLGTNLPVTLMSNTQGAYVLVYADAAETQICVMKQARKADLGRDGWAAFVADTEGVVAFLREGAENFPAYVQRAVAAVPVDTLIVWPFHVVPQLRTWSSTLRKITLLGDAAHALPPSTGQGANQVLEDAFTYGTVLAQSTAETLADNLLKWHAGRQARVDGILKIAKKMNARRLPQVEGQPATFVPGDLTYDWVFDVDYEKLVSTWLAR
ncbi:hypothetical protein SEUCBS139899_009860 [Sporothrix eucalyptigena]|uniref:FAD-binding domain-containing protein n=1 Tax=Sporothrix eucalyptigena TaxID=1812306 RepID=A0ABP0D053_9PEZI